jgi:protocatechuate 3,4-dioxygenase beta subunit
MMSSVPPFEGREGDNKTLDVMLSVAAPIGGLVVGPDGAGIPEARVIAMMFQNDKSSRGETLTDGTGAFQIQGLAPGSYILQVEAKGFRMQRANRVSTGDLNVRLELVAKASVSGRVTDGAGPVTAFEVRALRTTPNPSPGAPQVYENTPVLENFTGKADGRFELRGFDPGSYALRVSAPGYAPTLSETFNVLADQAPPSLTIRLQKGGKIEGRVVDGEGAPVAGAKITSHDGAFSNSPADRIFQDLLASAVTQKSVVSSIDGYFTLDQLTPGTYLLEVTHARYTSELVPNLNVLEGQALKAGNVTLRAGGSVSGTVRDASGQAVVRGMVQLMNTAQPSFSYEARTDAQGRYEFQHVKPGAYRLAATRNQAAGDAFEQILDVQTSDVSIAVSEGVPVKRDLTVGN